MQYAREKVEVNTGLWWGNLRERDCSEELGVDGDDNKIDL